MEVKFVKENRHANKVERDACVKALQGFGMDNPEDSIFYLYGRYDAPYGWYLFGVTPLSGKVYADGQPEKYLILGDCLDVLPDYNRVLTLKDVHEFAICEMDGRYEAIQEWGLFQSLSMEFKTALACVLGDDSMDETLEWNEKRKMWMLKFDVSFTTESNAACFKTIRIPAMFSTKEDADNEFAKEWEAYRKAFSLDDKVREYADNGFSFTDATQWAESKERALYKIRRAISNYLDEGITPDEDDALAESRERVGGETVWVLTIYKDGEFFPELHRTFEGAVEGVITDVMEGMEDEDDYDFDEIREELDDQMYWKDERTNTVYDIADCRVFA